MWDAMLAGVVCVFARCIQRGMCELFWSWLRFVVCAGLFIDSAALVCNVAIDYNR